VTTSHTTVLTRTVISMIVASAFGSPAANLPGTTLKQIEETTNEAIIAAARAAREHKDSIEAAKARVGAALDELSQALGGQKGTLERFGKNAAAMSEAWREAAASSWAKIESSARDVLAELETWLRRHSPPEENPEIPV